MKDRLPFSVEKGVPGRPRGQAPGSEGSIVFVVIVDVWGMFVSGLTASLGG